MSSSASSSDAAVLLIECCSDKPRVNLKRKRSELNQKEDVVVVSKVPHLDPKSPNFVIDIPDEIVLTIFKNLNGNDLFNLSR